MSEVWGKWQGRAINGAFHLRQQLGGSDHSAVFLADAAMQEPSAVAVKLIPTSPLLAEARLSDWRAAAAVAHPHLIRLLQAGQCELNGQPYVYLVMEHADQSLAQLLRNRPLTADEARELLRPTLSVLAFLHGQTLVLGGLKPTNFLAVGDRLKLASDGIHRVGGDTARLRTESAYDPPEARDGGYTAAGDIWGLGISLLEALTGRPPSAADEGRAGVSLPRDLLPEFRELIAGCLSRRPYDRPKVAEIDAWLRRQAGDTAPVGASPPGEAPARVTPAPAPSRPAAVERTPATAIAHQTQPVRARTAAAEPATPRALTRRSAVALVLGAVVVLALGWAGIRALSQRHLAPATVSAGQEAASAGAPLAAALPAVRPAVSAPAARPRQADAASLSSGVVHEEIPDVPRRARQTIRGRVRVSVRVIVDKEGKVVAALVDQPGPSRYFQRLAIEAAKKWIFPPQDEAAQRLKLVRFEFAREGTRGRAVALR